MPRILAGLALALALLVSPAAIADTLAQRSAETRLSLSYRVPDDAVQALLPGGWTLNGRGGQGPNLSIILADRSLYQDAEGQPIAGGRTRDVIFTASASNPATNQTRTFVVLTLSPERATPGPYGVSIPATFETRMQVTTGADDKPTVEQQWSVKLAEGGSLDMLVRYQRGPVMRSVSPANGIRPYSAKTPDFYRIYKTESGVDAITAPNAPPSGRLEAATLKAAGARLSALFNGSERLLAVTEQPYYLREVWLP